MGLLDPPPVWIWRARVAGPPHEDPDRGWTAGIRERTVSFDRVPIEVSTGVALHLELPSGARECPRIDEFHRIPEGPGRRGWHLREQGRIEAELSSSVVQFAPVVAAVQHV